MLVGHKFWGPLTAIATDPSVHISLRTLAQILVPLCFGGAAGVVVFFLVSGYIIAHVLQSEPVADFVVKRIFRIYPLYVFAVLLEITLSRLVDGAALPPVSELVPRLLLVGDFFDTPYGLGNVDWTLRIEILFYAMMAVLKALGLLNRPQWLPPLFVLLCVMLMLGSPFPDFAGWSNGYLNLYAPFLFIGTIIYLAEKRQVDRAVCWTAVLVIFLLFWNTVATMQPGWKESNYAFYGFLLFVLAWCWRGQLVTGRGVRVLSDLTFGVYLFHNWLWSYFERIVVAFSLKAAYQPIVILALLFAFCYLAHRLVERNGVRWGRACLNWIKRLRGPNPGSTAAPAGAEPVEATTRNS